MEKHRSRTRNPACDGKPRADENGDPVRGAEEGPTPRHHPARLRDRRIAPAQTPTGRGAARAWRAADWRTLLCCRADGEHHRPLGLTYEFARFIGRMKE